MLNNKLNLSIQINAILKDVCGSDKNIQLHSPIFNLNEWKYVKDCLDTGYVSSVGSLCR